MPRPVVRDERRRQIVRAALRLVQRRGVHGFTTADVAAEAGVSRGILHYHFRSKEEIAEEALRLMLDEFSRRAGAAVAAAGEQAPARLRAVVDTLKDDELSFYERLLEFWSPARRLAAHRAAMAALYEGWIASIAAIIREGIARGELATQGGMSPEDLASGLVALQDGLMVQRLLRREWMPATRACQIAWAAVDSWLRASLVEPSARERSHDR